MITYEIFLNLFSKVKFLPPPTSIVKLKTDARTRSPADLG